MTANGKKPGQPSVPFDPKLIGAMKDRFVLALVEAYDVRTTLPPVANWPGFKRKHIFDFVMGLRVIVSMDNLDKRGPMMHVSASVAPETPLFWRLEDTPRWAAIISRITLTTCQMVEELAGFRVPLRLLLTSEKGIIHLRGPTRKEYNKLARRSRQPEIP